MASIPIVTFETSRELTQYSVYIQTCIVKNIKFGLTSTGFTYTSRQSSFIVFERVFRKWIEMLQYMFQTYISKHS